MKAIAQAALTGMTRRLPARIPGTGAIGVAAALLCAGIVSLTLLRCESRYEYFIVEVDRLEVPDSLSCNDTLQVRLFGKIGVNSSYELDLIDAGPGVTALTSRFGEDATGKPIRYSTCSSHCENAMMSTR